MIISEFMFAAIHATATTPTAKLSMSLDTAHAVTPSCSSYYHVIITNSTCSSDNYFGFI